MPEFEDDDIDKLFEKIIESESLDEKNKSNFILKDLIFISQSFSRALEHVSELMLELMMNKTHSIDENVEEILGTMYKLSEDLDETMIELFMNDSEINDLDEENREDE